MPIYAKFIDHHPVFSGGVTVGAHAGWSRLLLPLANESEASAQYGAMPASASPKDAIN
jgi:hypothetical protein